MPRVSQDHLEQTRVSKLQKPLEKTALPAFVKHCSECHNHNVPYDDKYLPADGPDFTNYGSPEWIRARHRRNVYLGASHCLHQRTIVIGARVP